jgi:hypothetical protein
LDARCLSGGKERRHLTEQRDQEEDDHTSCDEDNGAHHDKQGHHESIGHHFEGRFKKHFRFFESCLCLSKRLTKVIV